MIIDGDQSKHAMFFFLTFNSVLARIFVSLFLQSGDSPEYFKMYFVFQIFVFIYKQLLKNSQYEK